MTIIVNHRRGHCGIVSLALAFNTSFKEMYELLKVIQSDIYFGITSESLSEAIKYCSAIYKRRAVKITFRGKQSDFIKHYKKGLYVLNCKEHVGILFNGHLFQSKDKDYTMYNAYQIL